MSCASSSEKSLIELSLEDDISSCSLRASSVAYFLKYSAQKLRRQQLTKKTMKSHRVLNLVHVKYINTDILGILLMISY